MNLSKKLVVFVLTLAIVFSNFSFATVDTQAAAKTKTTTNVFDSKKGVCYPTKIRVGLNSTSNVSTYVYLLNKGDYVASVKTNSSNLIAKLTRRDKYDGNYSTSALLDGQDSPEFCSTYGLGFLAKKKGTYTATVTVKNSKKKTVCKKKIKVIVDDNFSPVKSIKYAGKSFYGSFITKKKSGKISVAMNKGYKLQKIEVGTYVNGKEYETYDAEPEYKTVKNKKSINLATSTYFSENVNSSTSSYSYGDEESYSSTYKSGNMVDYLLPVTYVRVTYKDTKLGITQTTVYELFYQN